MRPNTRTIIGIATVPWRRRSLRHTVASLRHQGADIRVYVNGGPKPDFLAPEEFVMCEKADGDLGDVGKFYFLKTEKSDYYLTCDDDLLYPPDYVSRLTRELDARNGKAIVCLHGNTFRPPFDNFNGPVHYMGGHLPHSISIHNAGTGTSGLCPNAIPIDFSIFDDFNNTDLMLSVWAQKNNVPVISISRKEKWIVEQPEAHDSRSLWITESAKGIRRFKASIKSWQFWRALPDPASTAPKTSVAAFMSEEGRETQLKAAIDSIRSQVDAIRVIFKGTQVPSFLQPEECIVSRSTNLDFKDKASFDYLFSCRDSLVYPRNYVRRMITELDLREGKAIVGLRGASLGDSVNRIKNAQDVQKPSIVNVLDVQSIAFCPKQIDPPVRRSNEVELGMWAQEKEIPMVSIPRKNDWVGDPDLAFMKSVEDLKIEFEWRQIEDTLIDFLKPSKGRNQKTSREWVFRGAPLPVKTKPVKTMNVAAMFKRPISK